MPIARLRYTARVLRFLAILVGVLCAAPAFALDYDRNDIADREISFGMGLTDVDVNTASAGACLADRSRTCYPNFSRPSVFVVRGMARRHTRFLYVGGGMELGLTFPVDTYPVHPWVGLTGVAGVETANTGWERLRGYIEVGALVAWANTQVTEVAKASVEVGVRYQIRDNVRPHMQLMASLRGMTNMSHIGVMGFAGVVWTFD